MIVPTLTWNPEHYVYEIRRQSTVYESHSIAVVVQPSLPDHPGGPAWSLSTPIKKTTISDRGSGMILLQLVANPEHVAQSTYFDETSASSPLREPSDVARYLMNLDENPGGPLWQWSASIRWEIRRSTWSA